MLVKLVLDGLNVMETYNSLTNIAYLSLVHGRIITPLCMLLIYP